VLIDVGGTAGTRRSDRNTSTLLTAVRFVGHVLLLLLLLLAAAGVPRMAAFTADRGHVLAVLADRFTAFPARHPGLGRAELVCIAGCVGSTSPFGRDRALFVFVHRGKAPIAVAIA
jgi:hypothetical protein